MIGLFVTRPYESAWRKEQEAAMASTAKAEKNPANKPAVKPIVFSNPKGAMAMAMAQAGANAKVAQAKKYAQLNAKAMHAQKVCIVLQQHCPFQAITTEVDPNKKLQALTHTITQGLKEAQSKDIVQWFTNLVNGLSLKKEVTNSDAEAVKVFIKAKIYDYDTGLKKELDAKVNAIACKACGFA